MKIVKFILDPVFSTYSYTEESNAEMLILGRVFDGNFSCSSYLPTWAENEKNIEDVWVNDIQLEVQQDDIVMKDMHSEKGETSITLRMKKRQLIKLCDEWRSAVCKVLIIPQELVIIYKNGEYQLKVTKKSFSFRILIQRWFSKIGYPIFNEERHLEIVKFIQKPGFAWYSCIQDSNVEMSVLGLFFASNFFRDSFFYYDWTTKAKDGDVLSGNCISLEVEQDDIVLKDMYPEEGEIPASIRIKKEQFIKLCGEWLKNVCNTFIRPKKLAIVYKNGEYRLEIIKKLFSFKAFMNRWFY